MLPTWTYLKGPDSLYVNLFVGGSVDVKNVAGTDVRIVQKTEYPWKGKVSLQINPAAEKKFALKIRVPNRNVSRLYASAPACGGIESVTVNGEPVVPVIEKGYASIARVWKPGDIVEFETPLKVQRVKSSDKIAANAGRVALRYGPLIYTAESVDQKLDHPLTSNAPLTVAWKPDLLHGVLAIEGAYANGSPLLAIPYYARLNRGGRSMVWIKDR
jgi:DUF1680 family protein